MHISRGLIEVFRAWPRNKDIFPCPSGGGPPRQPSQRNGGAGPPNDDDGKFKYLSEFEEFWRQTAVSRDTPLLFSCRPGSR